MRYVQVRAPDEMHDQLAKIAKDEHRSLNAQIMVIGLSDRNIEKENVECTRGMRRRRPL